MDGEVVDMPERSAGDSGHEGSSPAELQPAGMHPLDTAEAVPARTKREMVTEGMLLVPNLAKLLFRLLRDNRVPARRRLAMPFAGAYVALPIDFIPDAIPFAGTIDDLFVLAVAIDYMLRVSPPEVIEEHWDGSEEGLELVRGMAAWGVELIPERLRRLVSPR
jgi:uncharacterized membrane protein YkvA (DUF1232 family)